MGKNFTLVQLRYFEAVARLEHMTAAAQALNVTQSTLSAAIAQLERELGVRLFTRLPRRGLALTPAGRRLLRGCTELLEGADLLQQAVREEEGRLTGPLVVGMFSPLAPFRAPVILQEFEREHPHVQVTFLEGDQETLRRALIEGRCELALMYDIGLDPELDREVVELIPPHVIVPAGHRLADVPGGAVALADLADDPLILLDLPHTREYFLSLFQLAGIHPRIRHRASGYETVRSFVGRGHGYSVLNQRISHNSTYTGGGVVPLALTDDLPAIRALLAYPPDARPSAKARAFAATARRLYGVVG